uniref:Uncharacterized protein n=1 Tax=Vespula pensylvanica TaxID=30213 RepID=A0A834NS11_VESPE|nr:hypothetical protein H0235_011240 [Vespula pensylvanica]
MATQTRWNHLSRKRPFSTNIGRGNTQWIDSRNRGGWLGGEVQESHVEGIIKLTQAYRSDTTLRKDEERLPWLRGWDPANPDLPRPVPRCRLVNETSLLSDTIQARAASRDISTSEDRWYQRGSALSVREAPGCGDRKSPDIEDRRERKSSRRSQLEVGIPS